MRAIAASPAYEFGFAIDADPVAVAVRDGLTTFPRWLPAWLLYDEAGSQLFEEITELDEYYLTRTERGILAQHADDIIRAASGGDRLRIAELGAGSAEKTRLLLRAAADQQPSLIYEPIDVSPSALALARLRIQAEIPNVRVTPYVADYTRGNDQALELAPTSRGERRLVLYIGSSIGNFEPEEASHLLRRVRSSLNPGDSLLLGVDLVKDEAILQSAYDDAADVTAAFNRNLLKRINRELGGNFDLDGFRHVALWNATKSRMEMHLESKSRQRAIIQALDLVLDFDEDETIHTENSYKYELGQAEAMLESSGFALSETWTDAKGWFAVILARAE